VEYVGYVPHALSLAHIRTATLGLGLLDDAFDYRYTSPNKLYEYMGLETPFVVSDLLNWRRSIDGVPAGLFVDPCDIEGVARQVNELVDDRERLEAMAVAGKRFIDERFNWGLVSEPMEGLIVDLLQDTSSPVYD
jgi:glycosyltransferase involved in cell wall biosynthesis